MEKFCSRCGLPWKDGQENCPRCSCEDFCEETLRRYEDLFEQFDEQSPAETPATEEPEKKTGGKTWILVCLLLLGVVGCVLSVWSTLSPPKREESMGSESSEFSTTESYDPLEQTVMTVGDRAVKVPEFRYFFYETMEKYAAYISYMGIDRELYLEQQLVTVYAAELLKWMDKDTSFLEDYIQDEEVYHLSWAGFFAELTKTELAKAYAIYEASLEEGYVPTEEVRSTIERELADAEAEAQEQGISMDSYLAAKYGEGCHVENYRDYLTVRSIAEAYASCRPFGEEEIEAEYASRAEELDVATYMIYTLRSDAGLLDSSYVSLEEEAELKGKAKEMAENFDESDPNVAVHTDWNRTLVAQFISKGAAQWMFETAQAGDVAYFEDRINACYHVVKLVERDVNYPTANLLMIRLSDAIVYGYFDAVPQERLSVEERLALITESLAQDGSEENFRRLAQEYSHSSPVEYKNASYSSIGSYSSFPPVYVGDPNTQEYDGNHSTQKLNWLRGERKRGEYEIFDGSFYMEILYYLGEGESYKNVRIGEILRNQWIEELTQEALATCNFSMDAALSGNTLLPPVDPNEPWEMTLDYLYQLPES